MPDGSRKWSRRSILGTLGLGAAAATSMLPLMPLSSARAEAGALPRRLLLLFYPFGKTEDYARLSSDGAQLDLGGMFTPLEPHRDVLTAVENLDKYHQGPGDPHQEGTTQLWTNSLLQDGGEFSVGGQDGTVGWSTAPDGSIDQYLAARLRPPTPFETLTLGVQTRSAAPSSRSIYAGPRAPITPHEDPRDVFQLLFGDFDPSQGSQALDRLTRQRRDVLGMVAAELGRVRGALPSSLDRERMDAHLGHVEALQARIEQLGHHGCAPPDEPLVDPGDDASLPLVTAMMGELVRAAFACDLTRFASIQLRAEGSAGTAAWLGNRESLHAMSHHEPFSDRWRQVYVSLMGLVADLVTTLRQTPEGEGSLLDNTLVVVGSGIPDSNGHYYKGNAVLLLGGGLPGNRYVDAGEASHGKLLVSLLRYFGIEDRETFGDVPMDPGPLPGLLA